MKRLWCPMSTLSGHQSCPQDNKGCSFWQRLFWGCNGEKQPEEVFFCELVAITMELNRGRGYTPRKNWLAKKILVQNDACYKTTLLNKLEQYKSSMHDPLSH